jgi:hypothetical protein
MPTTARVAVGLMGTLAALLLLYSAITWLGRDGLAEAVGRARPDLSADEAAQYVFVSALPYLILGVMLAVSAGFLPRRHAWARWTGVGSALLLTGMMLLSMVSIGGVTPISLFVLVLAVATVSSLVGRTTVAWVPWLRNGP